MVKLEGKRSTWSINDTLWKNRVGGRRLHPLTLNHAPQPGITLDLANVSGILEYVLKNISDQQYRSAIVFNMMAWSPVNRLVNTNQGIWNNHTNKHIKNWYHIGTLFKTTHHN